MPRVKRGVTARARHKKVLALAKGFRGRRGNVRARATRTCATTGAACVDGGGGGLCGSDERLLRAQLICLLRRGLGRGEEKAGAGKRLREGGGGAGLS